MPEFLVVALGALLIEAAVGYPNALFRRIGHPVTWIGALIGTIDRRWNPPALPPVPATDPRRRLAGLAAAVVIVGSAGLAGWALQFILGGSLPALLLLALLTSALFAQRSLHDHVASVERGLRESLPAGRRAVSMIVGRNPDVLDEAGVARAAIESLAENYSDGVVAPVLWTAVGGLAGGLAYKAANTADSMIGHKTARHGAFGWASARFDDLINLPASRLSALFLVLAAAAIPGASAAGAVRAVRRDAGKHRSPNAGWPEAAMAGALGLALNGPRVYGDTLVEDATMGDGRREATADDIARALRLYRMALMIEATVLAAVTAAVWL